MKPSNLRTASPAAMPPDMSPMLSDDDDADVAAAAPRPMPRVAELPSRATLPNGTVVEFVTDSLGRRLQIQDLDVWDEQSALLAMGAHSDNDLARARALLAMQIRSIDDEGLPMPQTFAQYRNFLRKVGKEGLDAVFAHRRPAPTGEPAAVLEGTPADFRLMAIDAGSVGVFPVEPASDRSAEQELKKK
jgi:hypothetical protein